MARDAADLVAELGEVLPVDVIHLPRPEPSTAVTLRRGDEALATVDIASAEGTLTITVHTEQPGQLGCDDRLAAMVLVVIAMRVGDASTDVLVLRTVDPIFRWQARRLGFEGALREPLRRVSWRAEGSAAARPEGPIEPPPLGVALAALLPDVEVTARPRRTLRQIANVAASGQVGIGEFDIVDLRGRRGPLRLSVLDRPGLLVENVAMAVDTTFAVCRTFGPLADHIRQLSFIRSMPRLRSGAAAGAALLNIGNIDLNGAFVTADGLHELRRQARARFDDPKVRARRPAPAPPDGFALDGVVAHECWHVIEGQFVSRRYPDSVAFRREVGEYFGVETLEHVTHQLGTRAPPELQAATARLAAEVSGYATTNPLEATAEMFKLWWCAPPDPPLVVTFFGGLLRRYFGVER